MIAFLQQHWEVLSAFATFCVLAAASTMPSKMPGSLQDLWEWGFNFTQEMISMRSAKLGAGAGPQVRTSVPAASLPEGEK